MARWNEEGPWRAEEDRRGSRRGDEWRRDEADARRAEGERWPGERSGAPSYGGPYRRGDDYGAREYGAADTGHGGRGERREYEREWPGREPAGRGGERRERGPRHELVGRRWGGGDYTTYGQSGFDESVRGAWMNEDLHREIGAGHPRAERPRARGPKGYRRPDQRIHEEVCDRIARSGVDAEDVEVRVEQGEVTLTGTTASRRDKRLLEDLADEVFGVEDVQNQLRVRRDAGGGEPDPDARH